LTKLNLNLKQKLIVFVANTALASLFVFVYLLKTCQFNYPLISPEAFLLFSIASLIALGSFIAICLDIYLINKLFHNQIQFLKKEQIEELSNEGE